MDLLLDTHAFLWFITGDNQLSNIAVDEINNEANRCFVSIASIWEIAIKISLNKLEIKGGFNVIDDFLQNNDVIVLPIDLDDTKELLTLEKHHSDPFDRMIIAQATSSNMVIITKDQYFKNYKVNIIW